jgi:Tol biopolymer transport system component
MEPARIVFTRFDGDGKEMCNDIYAIDPDGKNESRLTMNPGANGEYSDNAAPRYNSDRSLIAFVSTKNNDKKLYNIFFMDLATGKTAQITSGDLNISSVDWAPDDSRLVFSGLDDSGLQQVYVVSMDGTGFAKLTTGPSENVAPMWSPRGDLIVYVQFPPGVASSHIWIMDPSGGNQRQLSAGDALHTNASWSPDGSWLIFRCDLGAPHLRRLNVDTGEIVPYEPPARGVDSSPLWSGSEIIFSSNRDWDEAASLANLYRMSETGENIQRLTKTQTFEYCGDW